MWPRVLEPVEAQAQLSAEAAPATPLFYLLRCFLTPVDMSEGRDGDEDVLGDCWITSWEQQTVQELEREPDHQEHLQGEADAAAEKLWSLFQSAAQCVAVMYKGETGTRGGLKMPEGHDDEAGEGEKGRCKSFVDSMYDG